MSNFTKRLIALVLLLSHLLASCRWEVGECGRGAPGEPNECKAPGRAGHGRYVEDSPGVSLMTLEGFIAAFNRVCQIETKPIQQSPPYRFYLPPDINTTSTPLSPIRPLQPNLLSTSQLSLIPNQCPVNLHLPPLVDSSPTCQFLSSGVARDLVGSLWGLGYTLTTYSDQIQQHYKERATIEIAKMRAEAAKFERQKQEYTCQLAIKEAQKEEKRRLVAKEQKEKEKKEREAYLQKLIERRKEVEGGRTRVIKPENYFIANSSTANVKRTQESINKLRQRLAANSGSAGLTSEQQGDVKYILQRIDRLSKKLRDNIEDLKYFIEHPSPSVKYNSETFNLATKLLQDLGRQKEELRQLVSTRGVNLDNYVDVGTPEPEETQEERNAYKELTLAINDPSDAMGWVVFTTQQMKALLDANDSGSNKSESVKTQATLLATRVTEVLRMLQSKKIAITEAYFGAEASDYLDHSIEEGVQKLKFIEEAIDKLQESLDYFCTQFVVSPKASYVPNITKENLKVTINAVVDLLAPGSELVKAALGTHLTPSTSKGWADLALSAGLDFVPLGKTLKILIGPAQSTLHNMVKDMVIKVFKKRREITEEEVEENQRKSMPLHAEQADFQVVSFLQTIQTGKPLSEEQKQQSMSLLQQVEKLKKEVKAAYRLPSNPYFDRDIDVGSAVDELIQERCNQHKTQLQKLRQLRKQLKTACKFPKEDLAACKVKVKQQQEASYQTDSSDEERPYSDAELEFKRGVIKGIGQGLKNAPRVFIEGFADLLTNPVTTIEGIVEGLSNLPELPGHIFKYLETIEGDEEAKGAEIAEFITEQLITMLSPNKAKLLNQLSKRKLGVAALKLAKDAERILKLAKKYGLNASSATTKQLLENFDMRASDWIAKYRQGSIKSVLKDVGNKTIGEIFDSADSQTRKLIMDGRFAK